VDYGVGANLTGAVAAPFNTQQKQPVGEQNADALETSLPPVEQVKDSAAGKRVHAESPNAVPVQADLRREDSDDRREELNQDRIHEQVRALANRDRAVKNHERTHSSLAGRYAGAAHYEYRKGPDGVLYAVSGSVAIDTSPIPGDPNATLRKAQIIQRAAMGPSDPSPADRAIASAAGSMAASASAELARAVHQNAEAEGKIVLEKDDPTGESAPVDTRTTERADGRSQENEEEENLEEQLNHIELATQIMDTNLIRKLVELGVFKESQTTGTVLDLSA
jgi:hypothetical protein